jgi:hypothetical protein
MVEEKIVADFDPLNRLAEEFVASWREGNQPSIEEYVAHHPNLAEGIRSVFPSLIFLERNKPDRSAPEIAKLSNQPVSSGLLPERLGDIHLVHELGRGGMGIVFEAWQESLGRRVAVKVLPGSVLHDDRTRQRFLREARAIGRLRHPHIAQIHAVGEQDGVLYYVMDLIDGAGLDQLVTQEKTSETGLARARWVARLGIQAAEALTYAHSQGVLHRDVKPANLLLDQDGTVWLTDFGLAKLIDEQPLTASGEWLGTLRYLAPECLRGEASVRSDLYSLGLTLYELLVGVPAFPETERARLMRQISESSPQALRDRDRTIPPDLETIVMKASAREPEDRYATASELAEDLGRFLEGRAIQGHRAGAVRQLARWIRRNPALAALATTTIALVVVMSYLIGLYLFGGPRVVSGVEPPNQSAVSPATPDPGRDGPPWGFGLRHAPAGAGRGLRGPRRGPPP